MRPRLIMAVDYFQLSEIGLIEYGNLELRSGILLDKRRVRPVHRFTPEDFREAREAGIFESDCKLIDGIVMVPQDSPLALHGAEMVLFHKLMTQNAIRSQNV